MIHTYCVTQQWCRDNYPGFITKDEWPPSLPDINAPDYCLWAVLESEACSTLHHNTEALKVKLKRVWNKIPMETVDATINDFL